MSLIPSKSGRNLETGEPGDGASSPHYAMHNIHTQSTHLSHALAHASFGGPAVQTGMFPVAMPHGRRVKNNSENVRTRKKKKKRKENFRKPRPCRIKRPPAAPGPFPRAGQDPVTGPHSIVRAAPRSPPQKSEPPRSLPVLYCMYNTVTIKSRATLGLRPGHPPRPSLGKNARLPAPGDSGWAVQVDHRMKRDTHTERGLVEAPRRSPRVDVDHSGGRLHYLSRPGPRTERTHTRTPLPLRPWTGIRKSGVVDSSLCQGGQKGPHSRAGAETTQKMEGRFLRGQFIYDVHHCAIIYQIREEGSGSEGRALGEVGGRSLCWIDPW